MKPVLTLRQSRSVLSNRIRVNNSNKFDVALRKGNFALMRSYQHFINPLYIDGTEQFEPTHDVSFGTRNEIYHSPSPLWVYEHHGLFLRSPG